jgi:hypothetical protein
LSGCIWGCMTGWCIMRGIGSSGMSDSLLRELAPAIADLVEDRGRWTLTSEHWDREFGNAIAQLASLDFDLRVNRDRGDILIDVRPHGKACWHRLENVLEFVVKRPQSRESAELAASLRAHYEEVKSLMSTELAHQGLHEFERERSDAVRREIWPSS